MHIEHLRELAVTIVGLLNKDTNMMKYLDEKIEKLCNSILRDCCIEMATSRKDLDLAISTENCTSLLESYRQIRQIPGDIAEKCQLLFTTRDSESTITANFLVIVPELEQTIKEIFRDEKFPHQQNGLRGVCDETALQKMVSNIQEAAKEEKILRLFCEVSCILEHLCLNNNGNRSTENEIHQWGSSNMIISMLQFLEKFFQSSEEQRLFRRLQVFSFNIRDIMLNPESFERNFFRDFHNVALSLLKFAKFDPSQLVRFELSDPTNSCHTQGNDGLKYDKSEEIFSQLFWIIKESDDELQLEAIAHVHIHGRIRSIGAFESLITLPVSCGMIIDRLPIDSVVVRREHDDSRNLRVTLYATQKEKISNALKYLENELGADVVDLSQTDIASSHLKMRSFAKAGTLVSLRLVHKWESEKLVLDSNDFVTLADSTAGGVSVPHPEMAGLLRRGFRRGVL